MLSLKKTPALSYNLIHIYELKTGLRACIVYIYIYMFYIILQHCLVRGSNAKHSN